jgi:hypothetical protein
MGMQWMFAGERSTNRVLDIRTELLVILRREEGCYSPTAGRDSCVADSKGCSFGDAIEHELQIVRCVVFDLLAAVLVVVIERRLGAETFYELGAGLLVEKMEISRWTGRSHIEISRAARCHDFVSRP